MLQLIPPIISDRRLYGDSICFANVAFWIDSIDTSEQIFTKL